ncbi:hypothetical protein IAU59_000638 [Kwoniella sp. CBS 9459]
MPSILQAPPPPAASSSSRAKVNGTSISSESSTMSLSSPQRLRNDRVPLTSEPRATTYTPRVNGHSIRTRKSSSFDDENDFDDEREDQEEDEDEGEVNYAHDENEQGREWNDTEADGSDVELEIEEESDEDSVMEDEKTVVHVEVRLMPHSTILSHHVQTSMMGFLANVDGPIALGTKLSGWEDIAIMDENVDRVWVEEGLNGVSSVRAEDANIQIHVYHANETDVLEEFSADFDDDDEEKVTAASMRTLPSLELDGVWDTLVYADDLKARLLHYINSTILFSESRIDFNVIAWNRVVLLHGPPGTGKTSLCRALAQKIAVRLGRSYCQGKLIEINSHSLFSKWFSESGKLVQRLFETVTKEVDDESQFVVVMIDEVESLTAARAGAMRGNEPSDSLRVVNALLTQLDKLRTRKNVLVMTTSNLADAIDEAFISRVDMQEYVPLPPPQAVYYILSGCLEEMMDKGLMKRRTLLKWDAAEYCAGSKERESNRKERIGSALASLAKRCHSLELSGRTLRKLPVLAHARFLFSPSGDHRPHSIERWIEAMDKIVDIEENKKKQEAARAAAVHAQLNSSASRGGESGHARGASASIDRSEVGTMVGTAMAGEKGPHQGHHH